MSNIKFHAVTELPEAVDSGHIYFTKDGSQYVGTSNSIALKISDVLFVETLPVEGIESKLYIQNNRLHIWDGAKFENVGGSGGGGNKAEDITIKDVDSKFTATNVEGALLELFLKSEDMKQGVVDVFGFPLSISDTTQEMINKMNTQKQELVDAVIEKGLSAYTYNSISELATKVTQITKVDVLGTVKRTSKINVKAPYTHEIVLSEPLSLKDIAVSVLEFVGNEEGVVHYTAEYNNGESTSFDFDDRFIVFDGLMRLKDEYDFIVTEVEENFFETEIIDFSEFVDIEEVAIDYDKITLKAVPQGQIIKANGNISLNGVGEIGSIDVIHNAIGNGIANMAISFDGGQSYHAYNGSDWNAVNIEDKEDFKMNGMSSNLIGTLTNDQLSAVRNDTKLRFAYYLERPNYADDANQDRLQITVSMNGYDILADMSNYSYSYDRDTQTLRFMFMKDGTYTITYADAL